MPEEKYRILIVDDEPEFHKQIRFAFKSSNFIFEGAIGVSQLEEKLKERTEFDLVLLDLKLDNSGSENMIGLELITELKTKRPYWPIVVVTNDRQYATVVSAMKKGADDFLQKDEYDVRKWSEKFIKACNNTIYKKIVQLKNELNSVPDDRDKIDKWNELARLYLIVKNIQDSEEARSKAVELEDELDFQDNINHCPYVESISIDRTLLFDTLHWKLQNGSNVLLGKNGFGKTLLLRLIAMFLQYKKEEINTTINQEEPKSLVSITLNLNQSKNRDIIWQGSFTKRAGKIPILAISDARYLPTSRDHIAYPQDEKYHDLVKEGGYFFIHRKFETERHNDFLWKYANSFYRNKKEVAELTLLVENIIHALSGNDHFRIVEARPKENFSSHFELLVKVNKTNDDIIPLQWASRGTISVLTIFSLIYYHLKALQKERNENRRIKKKKIQEEKGIVIIDEIDAHLHPSWQRKILFLLEKHFPNVQFIVSSHSPLVVAGRKPGEVAVLRESEENKYFSIWQPNQQSFIGAKTEDLYNDIFDIEDLDQRFINYWEQIAPYEDELLNDPNKIHSILKQQPHLEEIFGTISSLKDFLARLPIQKQNFVQKLEIELLEHENNELKKELFENISLIAQLELILEKSNLADQDSNKIKAWIQKLGDIRSKTRINNYSVELYKRILGRKIVHKIEDDD